MPHQPPFHLLPSGEPPPPSRTVTHPSSAARPPRPPGRARRIDRCRSSLTLRTRRLSTRGSACGEANPRGNRLDGMPTISACSACGQTWPGAVRRGSAQRGKASGSLAVRGEGGACRCRPLPSCLLGLGERVDCYCWRNAVTGVVPLRSSSPVERWTKATGIVMLTTVPSGSVTGLLPPTPTSASAPAALL
jgi:hypothetical protein